MAIVDQITDRIGVFSNQFDVKDTAVDDYDPSLDEDNAVLAKDFPDLVDPEDETEDSSKRTGTLLNYQKRFNSRQRAVRAAMVGFYHRGNVHYTMGGRRWSGIDSKRHAKYGQYPFYADCSAFTTWCLWDATAIYGIRDFVNGAAWRGGFTGTQTHHGVPVSSYRKLLTGDLVFYGGSYWTPSHVAIYVGNGKVVSHGSESGPYLLPWNYRRVTQMRRYIR
jgi:cell wall-associated NlpC family hydrolase